MTYLRVKKWKDWQHYKDREPPWVKLWGKLLHDDKFLELSEPEQWQLVRVWMVASLATRFTLDEEGRVVPVVANNESTVRRATYSLKRVPLGKFVDAGWLVEVAAVDTFDASAVIAPGKHSVDGNGRVEEGDASALLVLEKTEKKKDLKGFTSIVDFWLERAPPLIEHRGTIRESSKAQRAAAHAVESYGLEDVLAAVGAYADVLGSPAHFFEYRWTLPDFLKRGLPKFVPEADPLTNFRIRPRPGATRGMSFEEILAMNGGDHER